MQYEASTDDKWIKNKISPLLYNNYPIAGSLFINWRSTDSLGLPPVRAMYLRQDEDSKKLEETDYEGNASVISSQYAQFIYTLPFYCYYDYTDLQIKSANYLSTKSNKTAETLLLTPFPTASSGTYTFKVKYILPGINIVTSEKILKINNP